jgi:hypothetical protein
VVGEPVPATSEAAAVVKFDPRSCNTTNNTGAWVPASKKLTLVVVTANARKTGKITSLGVFHPGVMTAEGIGVTSSLAQLKLAYPDIVSAGPGPSTDMFVLNGTVGHLIFEVAWSGAKAKGYWPKAEQGTVLWMRAETKTTEVYSIANSDAYGVCHG